MALPTYQKKVKRRVLISAIALILLPMAFFYTTYAIENKPLLEIKQQASRLSVASVIEVSAKSYTAQTQGHGEGKARYQLSLLVEVDVNVNKKLLSGCS